MLKASKEIREKVLYDNEFSLRMAELLGIAQVSVKHLARRNSDKLTLAVLVKFYKEQGFTEEQIFDN
ncbi:MAG: hypothetical protein KGV59_06155 [Tenacibaculum sp.]|nr:hypothetical protein [Tenacibaculum sp.]